MSYEFVIALVVLIGGGYLISRGVATEISVAAISTVLAFWFNNRAHDTKNKKTPDTLPKSTDESVSDPFDVAKK